MYWLAIYLLFQVPDSNASPILTCHTQSGPVRAVLEIDEIGKGNIVLIRGQLKNQCDLKIRSLTFREKRFPGTTLVGFQMKGCNPSLSDNQKSDFFNRLTLEISDRGQSPIGYLQWFRRGETSRCDLTKYDKESLNRNFQKWKEGLWGR